MYIDIFKNIIHLIIYGKKGGSYLKTKVCITAEHNEPQKFENMVFK